MRNSRVSIDGGIMVCCNKLLSVLQVTGYYAVPIFLPYPSFLMEVMGIFPLL